MQLRQELKHASDHLSKKKADRLEELLTELVNEVIDNHKQTEALVKKSADSEMIAAVQNNRISIDGVVTDLFREIGREKAIVHIKNDIQGGRRASVLLRQQQNWVDLQTRSVTTSDDDDSTLEELNPNTSISGLLGNFWRHKKSTSQPRRLKDGASLEGSFLNPDYIYGNRQTD